jgi:hypothetical protein
MMEYNIVIFDSNITRGESIKNLISIDSVKSYKQFNGSDAVALVGIWTTHKSAFVKFIDSATIIFIHRSNDLFDNALTCLKTKTNKNVIIYSGATSITLNNLPTHIHPFQGAISDDGKTIWDLEGFCNYLNTAKTINATELFESLQSKSPQFLALEKFYTDLDISFVGDDTGIKKIEAQIKKAGLNKLN